METITIKATSKAGKLFKREIEIEGESSKSIMFSKNSYGEKAFLPKLQIIDFQCGEYATIPMWLFGKLFFDNNA